MSRLVMRRRNQMRGVFGLCLLLAVLLCAPLTGRAASGAKAGGKRLVTSIRLNQKNIHISVGRTYTLKAAVRPVTAANRAVKWSSSNKRVVKVNSKGKIRALKAGSAVITAKAKDGSGRKAICRVTVKAPVQADPARTVKLDRASVTLAPGEQVALKAATSDGTEVYWGSSAPAVASVSGGTVTAKAEGSAVIAARRRDGLMTVFCRVTVEKKQPEAGSSARAAQLLGILKKYSDRVESDRARGLTWAYSNSAPGTWKKAASVVRSKKITYCNCALLVRWALRDMGVLDSANFWGIKGGAIHFSGSSKEQLLKYCEIIPVFQTPDQMLAQGGLLPGDICTWVNYQHTNVYAGDGLWYDSGRSGGVGSYEGGTFVFRSFGPAATVNMSGTTIGYIIRFVR